MLSCPISAVVWRSSTAPLLEFQSHSCHPTWSTNIKIWNVLNARLVLYSAGVCKSVRVAKKSYIRFFCGSTGGIDWCEIFMHPKATIQFCLRKWLPCLGIFEAINAWHFHSNCGIAAFDKVSKSLVWYLIT